MQTPPPEASSGPCGLDEPLRSLQLSAVELAALSSQGFVAREKRGGAVLYKLRFRVHGRQRVKSLGQDACLAAEIERALQVLQCERRRSQRQREARRRVALLLRSFKKRLEPLLTQSGRRFHGSAIRKTRVPIAQR